MRLQYSKYELQRVFNSMVKSANLAFDKGDYEKSRHILETAADYQYCLNIVYSDSKCEDLIQRWSEKLGIIEDYLPIKGNILFYDCFAWDNRGLTQQYLDALLYSHKYNVLFIHETVFEDSSKETLAMLHENGIEVKELGHVSWDEKQRILSDVVLTFRPEKVLCHLTPNTILPLITFGRFKKLEKYQINLTDHAFWLGGSVFDYSFEFREYGCQLSNTMRHISKDKLLLLPYYPWENSVEFEGFPIDVTEKIVLFAGGSFYKIEDDKDTFFHIVRTILEQNSKTVMMLAGDGNREHLKDLIKEYHLEKRFFLLGNRKDICQLFAHSHIYISTYPLGGGLMSQYAAVYGLPILMYKSYDVEQIVCTKQKGKYAFDSINDLLCEAGKLVSDSNYREDRGKFFQSLMTNKCDFRNSFAELFEQGYSNVNLRENYFDFDNFYKQYLIRLNTGKLFLNLENNIRNACSSALSWKMWANIYLSRILNKIHSLCSLKNI